MSVIDDKLRLLLRGGPRHRCRRLVFEEGRARIVIRYPTMTAISRRAWHRSGGPSR